jgi:hypothetical protein
LEKGKIVREDQKIMLLSILVGVIIGIAILPFQKFDRHNGPLTYVLGWAAFWPYLALGFAYFYAKEYIKAWYALLDHLKSIKEIKRINKEAESNNEKGGWL